MEQQPPRTEPQPATIEQTAQPRKKKSRRRWLLFFLKSASILIPALAALAVLLEVLARWYVAGTWGFLVPDEQTGWAYRPNHEALAIIDGPGGFYKKSVRINSLGFRDREFSAEKAPGTIRIAVLGDSYVAAIEVDESEMFTQVLQRRLNETAPAGVTYEVIAAGNGNYGVDQSLLFYRERVRPLSPDVVIFVIFPFNDFCDILPELNDHVYMPKRFFTLKDGALEGPGELQTTQATLSLKPATPPLYERIPLFSVGLLNQWTHSYAPRAARLLERAGLFPPDMIRDAEGVPMIWGIARKPLTPEWHEAIELGSALIDQFRQDAEADGASFHLVLMPFAEHLALTNPDWVRARLPQIMRPDFDPGQPENQVRAICEQRGVDMLDLFPVFMEATRTTGQPVNLLPNIHLNHYGHEVLAAALAEFLAPSLTGLPPDQPANP